MKIFGILETCLYAENLEKAKTFYSTLPGIEFISEEKEHHLFFTCGNSMLLIFNPLHTSTEQTHINPAYSRKIIFQLNRKLPGPMALFLSTFAIRPGIAWNW